MIKRLLLLIFIIFTQLSYSVNMDDIVDGFIDMKINRIDEKFYPLYIDELRQIGYLPMKNFLALIELENNKVDLENMSVTVKLPDGKERSYTFSDEYAFVDGEELYVNIYEIGKLLPAKKVEFNLATLISKIDFDFSLPSDIRYQQEKARMSMTNNERKTEEKEHIKNHKIFSPGVVKLEFEKANVEDKDGKSLRADYITQFLYGTLEADVTLLDDRRKDKNRVELEEISLSYYNVMDRKDITLGNVYLSKPDFYRADTKLIGINIIDSSDRFNVSERNGHTFEGFAPSGTIVELYRNGILTDYQTAEDRRYVFHNVDIHSLTDKYFIRIYNPDGTYIQKDISLLLNNKNIKKNSWTYSLQGGQIEDKKDNNFIGNVRYGLSDYLTLQLGYNQVKSKSVNFDEYRDIVYGAYLNSPPIKFPFWANIFWYQDVDNEDGTLTWEYKQNIYDFTLYLEGEKYSKRISKEENIDEKYAIELMKSFWKLNTGVGYEIEKRKIETYEVYRGSLGYSKSYFSLTGEYKYHQYSHVNRDNYHTTKYQLGLAYFSSVSINFGIEVNYDEKWKPTDEKYRLKFVRRNSGYYSKRYFDTAIEFIYSEKDRDRFRTELSATLYLEDFGLPFVNAEIDINADDRKSDNRSIGVTAKKVFILEDITKDSRMKNISNSWVSGRVFIDNNGNSVYDEDIDEVLSEVEVSALGKKVETDRYGMYFIEDISSNSIFNVKVDRTYIDPLLYYDDEKYYKLMPASGMKIDIPFQLTTSLSGNIKVLDDVSEEKLPYIYNRVQLILKKDGVELKRFRPEFDGYYIVDGLVDGEYQLELTTTNEDYYLEKESEIVIIRAEDNSNGVFELDEITLIKRESE